MNIEEKSDISIQKEILEKMHKWTSLSWQQSRKEAFLQLQNMRNLFNYL